MLRSMSFFHPCDNGGFPVDELRVAIRIRWCRSAWVILVHVPQFAVSFSVSSVFYELRRSKFGREFSRDFVDLNDLFHALPEQGRVYS